MAVTKPAYEDPDYKDEDLDASLEFFAELQRVAPDSTQPSSFFVQFPRDQRHALEVLRRIPDGAGLEAFLTALAESVDDDESS